jgi:GntR family transcriptional regulator of gluconate operon
MKNDATFQVLSAPPRRILSDHVADQLRQAIVTEQLGPGQRIVEGDVADAMGTSRGPVRDALRQLEIEGLVQHYPHRGTFVTCLTPQDVEEIYTLRIAIETLAVDYAIKNATSEQIDALDGIVDQIAAQTEQDYTPLDSTGLDLEFHRTLCRISGHKRALSAWEALSGQTRVLLLYDRVLQPERWKDFGVEWHGEIVASLRQRDADLAYRIIRKHLLTTLEIVLNGFAHGTIDRLDADGKGFGSLPASRR